jgi:hypothetical protein
VDVVEDGGLEAGEGEVEGVVAEEASGEGDGLGVALGGEAVEDRPARVAQTQECGDLVVGLADGVVDGGADQFDVEPVAEVVEGGVSAGADEAYGGEGREGRRMKAEG